jgi:serine/threonine protein kinase/Flp pilus assembly protein TadD
LNLGRTVALKLPLLDSKEAEARFLREGRALAALRHDHVVIVFEADKSARGPYLAMEYLPGGTLRDRIRAAAAERQYLSLDQLVTWGTAIADALYHTHREGITHCDVKPGNVMFDREGRPKLMDFGLARVSGAAEPSPPGTIAGTFGYMPPEQSSGGEPDFRSDLFSLGVVLYEMATLRQPFQGRSRAELVQSIKSGRFTPPNRLRPELGPEFDRIIATLLSVEPRRRYQSADVLARDLKSFQAERESFMAAETVAAAQKGEKPSPEAIRAHLEKILAFLSNSPNSKKLLRYVVEETLAGREEGLKEYTIAIGVFEKGEDFDSNVDNTVRREANRLRQRLDTYYNGPGHADEVRIQIPKGAYRPVFRFQKQEPEPAPAPGPAGSPWWLNFWRGVRDRPKAIVATAASAGAALALYLWIAPLIPPRQPAERHLVILPFTALGPHASPEELRRGILLFVTGKLSEFEGRVKSFEVEPADNVLDSGVESAAKACRGFGATLVMTGSIELSSGSKTRMTVTLLSCGRAQPKTVSSKINDVESGSSIFLEDSIVNIAIKMLHLPESVVSSSGRVEPQAEDFYLQGRGYLSRGDPDNAILQFQQALDLDSQHALAHAGLGEAYLSKYEITKQPPYIDMAKMNCRQALQINNEIASVYVTEGKIEAANGHYSDAVQEFKSALQIDSEDAAAYAGLGAAYYAQGYVKEAEDTYEAAIRSRRDWSTYRDLGVFYFTRGRYTDAEKAFRYANNLAPDNAEVLFQLGRVLYELGHSRDAEADLKRSLGFKANARAYNDLAAIYFYEGRYADAVEPQEKAVALSPRDGELLGSLARTYKWAGRSKESSAAYPQAIQLLREQLEINPQDAQLRALLALFLAETGNLSMSRKEAKQARQTAPQNTEVLFVLLMTYEIGGDRKSALDCLGTIAQNGQIMAEICKRPELESLRRDAGFAKLTGGSACATK